MFAAPDSKSVAMHCPEHLGRLPETYNSQLLKIYFSRFFNDSRAFFGSRLSCWDAAALLQLQKAPQLHCP